MITDAGGHDLNQTKLTRAAIALGILPHPSGHFTYADHEKTTCGLLFQN
jgi:hypothetical protein